MTLHKTIAALLTCALASAQTPQLLSQQDQDRRVVIRINVNLVQVDAVVTDSHDNPVTDLTADDFIVLQDGKTQEITNFSYVRTHEAPVSFTAAEISQARASGTSAVPPAPPMLMKPQKVRRTIALVVDDLGLSFEGTVRVREALRKWIDEEMQPGDLVAVILTGVGLGALQQFTGDKRMLYASIERIKFNLARRVGVSSFAPLQAKVEGGIDDRGFGEERDRSFTLGSLGAIQYVVNGLKSLPGRKSLILFSESMKIMFSEGRDQFVKDALQRLIDAANRAAVVIHTVDPRGVVFTGLTAEDNINGFSQEDIGNAYSQRLQQLIDSQDGMVLLAKQTGGLFEAGKNDIGRSLRRIMEDGEGYYLIGYRPDEQTIAEMTANKLKFHTIRVRVKRPGLNVRSRSGFFGQPDQQAAPKSVTRQERIVQALYSPFATGDLRVRLTTLFSQTQDEKSCINALLHFDANKLVFMEQPDGWYETDVAIVAATFDADGQQIDIADKVWFIRVKGRTYERMKKKGIAFLMRVPVKTAGAYQMRAVVCDTRGDQLGSATQFIEVPKMEEKQLMISGIVLAADELQPKAAIDQAEGVMSEDNANRTAAVRVFEPGDSIAWAYQVLNAKTDSSQKPQLEVQVKLFRDGKEVYTGQSAPMTSEVMKDTKRMIATGRMELKQISPGDYALQVIVTDLLANKKHRMAAQSIDFGIQR